MMHGNSNIKYNTGTLWAVHSYSTTQQTPCLLQNLKTHTHYHITYQ